MTPWAFQEAQLLIYVTDFPDHKAEIEVGVDLIKFQGWFKLFLEPCEASITQVRQYYKYLKKNEPTVEKTASTSCQFYWKDEDLTVTVRDLARIYGLKT